FHSFPGNILDVVVLEQKASIIGSIDNVHEAGSKEDVRSDEAQEAVPRVHSLSFGEVSEVSTDVQEADLASVTNIISKDRGLRKHRVQEDVMGLSKALSELLYGVEHLRKRSPDD
ncbi:MAG: hypothetical protein M1830_000990, partial [Pleopsidium flavum]